MLKWGNGPCGGGGTVDDHSNGRREAEYRMKAELRRLLKEFESAASSELADVACYAAPREDIKRRLAEVRREKELEGDDASKYGKGYYDGEIGALVNLLWRDDVRNEASHNSSISRESP